MADGVILFKPPYTLVILTRDIFGEEAGNDKQPFFESSLLAMF
jgi:hypothetical protein